jgi:PKHD-type hydroxylase
LTSAGLNINHKTYKYNITHSNQTEFLMYEQNGKYKAHTDMFHEHSENTRKLTCLAFLNDDFEGGKFFIQTSYEKIYPFQEKGSIVIFPSYMLHGVEDVIKGNRFTVVTWLEGSYFK